MFVELYNYAVNFLAKRLVPRLDIEVQYVVMLNVHCRLVRVPLETLFFFFFFRQTQSVCLCSVPEG